MNTLSQLIGSLCVFAMGVHAVEIPMARIIVSPGAEYSETVRSWQGIPGIERAPNGRLWATWYSGGPGEGDIANYTLVASSGNDGKTWSKPQVAIQGAAGTATNDPIPWLDPKGRLWVFYHQSTAKTATYSGMHGTFAIRTDQPDSANPKWSDPMLVAESGVLFGKPVVRADGGWLAPFFNRGVVANETGTLLSTDEGATWTWLGGTSIPESLRNFSEATLALRRDGSVWTVIRTNVGLYESSSTDGGSTWSAAQPMKLFGAGPATRAHMRRLASGAFLLVYHDSARSEKGKFGRERLAAWLSDDEGRTWPHKLLLDERRRVSYPDATQGPDGRIYVAYDRGRYQAGEKQILLSIIREEDIRSGKTPSPIVINQTLAYGNHADLRDEEKVAKSLPPKERFHLYLLIGQSNMAGRGALDPAYPVSQSRLLKFSPRNVWAPGTDPLHFDKPAVAGVGLGTSFARAMADTDKSITVGVIPCAVGGTPLERWVKGGDLYEQAVKRTRLAMKDGVLKGILWHQGEADSGTEKNARSYADRLAKMIADLRADLGAGEVPFVAGKLGEFLKRESASGKPSLWPVVNEQIASLPQRVPRTAVVESSGLQHKGDGVHFDTPSLREFGKRYAAAMTRLLSPQGTQP
jgi:predicted neuraminidase